MKIGLFFGSFNPIHTGHLIIANYVLESTELQQVWLVVSPQNPLKKKSGLLNEYDRLHLCELAIGDNTRIKASNIEFHLPQPSYTIDTLTYLQEKYPAHEFYLIMGSDNLETLPKWKNFELLLQHYYIIVYERPGFSGSEWKNHPHVQFLQVPLLSISSTLIRQMIKEGRSVRYMVPEAAFQYIEEMHFYER